MKRQVASIIFSMFVTLYNIIRFFTLYPINFKILRVLSRSDAGEWTQTHGQVQHHLFEGEFHTIKQTPLSITQFNNRHQMD